MGLGWVTTQGGKLDSEARFRTWGTEKKKQNFKNQLVQPARNMPNFNHHGSNEVRLLAGLTDIQCVSFICWKNLVKMHSMKIESCVPQDWSKTSCLSPPCVGPLPEGNSPLERGNLHVYPHLPE